MKQVVLRQYRDGAYILLFPEEQKSYLQFGGICDENYDAVMKKTSPADEYQGTFVLERYCSEYGIPLDSVKIIKRKPRKKNV